MCRRTLAPVHHTCGTNTARMVSSKSERSATIFKEWSFSSAISNCQKKSEKGPLVRTYFHRDQENHNNVLVISLKIK